MSDSTNITNETISKLGKLSRLLLLDEEVQNGTEQLSHVLQHFAMIQKIKLDDMLIEPSSELINISRPDVAKANRLCSNKQLMENAPELFKGQVKVRAVFS